MPDLLAAAKKCGYTDLALTDNGSLYGAIEFYEAALKAGIKPIIGCELYVAPGARGDTSPDQRRPYHLIVLAENNIGYQNLLKLVSRAALEGLWENLPRVDKELLREYHPGLIALSGGKEGEVPQLILGNDKNKAQAVAQEYQEIFGADNWFLEMQDHPDLPGQFVVNEGLQEIARATDTPLVVTRDVHYLHPEDAEAQDVMECIGAGKTVRDQRPESLLEVDRSFSTPEEIAERWRHLPVAIENTEKIAARCNVELKLGAWNFPDFKIPEGKTHGQVLEEDSRAGLAKLLPDADREVHERLEYELDVINKKGYAPYFLTVADYIRWARENGIVATTRGSAAGSLVSYTIGITTVNPLYFKLPFERFLNMHRPSPPDVDGDFADDRREDVINYVTQKYGKEQVAQIITFGTMMARASIRDAGRALGFSYSFCDGVAKLIPFGSQGFAMTIARALQESPDLKKIYDEQTDVQRLLNIAQKIEGCARHTSIHAAGVVIAPRPLTEFTPVQYEVGGSKITTQYEMNAVEKAGVLKMDFLGIRNLSILGNAVKLVRELYGTEIDLVKIPWDDAKTYDMLARGETAGVFQLSGGGMTRYLKELKPSNIFDIMVMVALYRPGPMDCIPEYIKRKHDPRQITFLDERLRPILDQSLGILVYQDDVMLIAISLAGYSWEEADKFRKAMGKKIPEEMAKQKVKFFAGCLQNGLREGQVETLWQQIEPFAAYGFGRAHAASYAVVAYQTAYLKANFPAAYMCSVLSAESDDAEKVADIVHECERIGVPVLPPHLNESFTKFSVIKNEVGVECIRFGLSAIKNVGEHITKVLIAEREKNGTYQSITDLLTRTQDKDLNKKSLESLIKCGALDFWGERGWLLANAEKMLLFSRQMTDEHRSNQSTLFGGAATAELILAPAPPASLPEKLIWERELIGLYFSSHPFADYALILRGAYTEARLLENESAGGWVIMCGLVAEIKKKWTKNGAAMMMAKVEDLSGNFELLVFPKTYEKTAALWELGNCLCIWGKKSSETGDNKVLVEKAELLTVASAESLRYRLTMGASATPTKSVEAKEKNEKSIIITLPADLTEEKKIRLKEILSKYHGEYLVYLILSTADATKKIKTNLRTAWNEELARQVVAIVGTAPIIQ